jgi:hypothetical protein
MHRRVRWENVVRAAGAGLLVAVVVAWPRLAPPEPALPGAGPAPLVEAEPSPAVPAGTPPPRRGGPTRAHERARPDMRLRARRRGPVAKRRASWSRSRGERPAREREPGVQGGEGGDGRDEATGGGTGSGGTMGSEGGTGSGTTGLDGGTRSGGGPAGGGGTIAPDPAQAEFGFEAG